MPPIMLINSLEALRRKVKLLGVVLGAGVVVASAILLLLAAILLDYSLNLHAIPRVLIILAALSALGYVLVQWVIKPLLARITLSDVAGRLEHVFPQFDDRLRSTIDFVGQPVPGSEVMKQRVITEAAALADRVDFDRAIVMRPVWMSASAGLGAVILALILSVVVSSTYLQIALSRLLNPFADNAWPKRVQIDLLEQLPARVPVGQRVPLKMKLVKGDKASMKAIVHYQYGNGPWQQELMTRGNDGTYAASLDARADSSGQRGEMKVRVTAGDDAKELGSIAVLPRLAVTRVEATITPPPYVGENVQSAQVNLSSAPALMAGGSQVALKISFNKPLDGEKPVELVPVDAKMVTPDAKWKLSGDGAVTGTWTAAESLRFHVRATDTDGFQNSGLEEYELIVRPDQDPIVQIEIPRRNEERTPVATVPLQAVAEDDYGIQSLKLVVDRLGDKKHWETDLITNGSPVQGVQWAAIDGAADRQRFRLNYDWDLSQLASAELKPGDVLEYFLLVQDNFNLNGVQHSPAASGKLRIAIISQEQLANAITNELRTIANQITEIRNNQNRTKEETGALAQETAEKPQFDEGDRAITERLSNQQSTAASQTKQVATKLAGVEQRMAENKSPAKDLSDLARDVKDVLNKAAEEPMKEAVSKLTNAQEQGRPAPKRNDDLAQASSSQQQASDQLQRALDRMANIGSIQQTIERFKELLAEQRKIGKETREIGNNNLGKKPEQMSPEDRQKLEQNAAEQDKLAAKTQKALDELEKMSEQLNKADPSTSEAMSKAARTGKQQQVSPSQQRAAQQTKQNQQAGAQAAQKQAELGLEMILNDLREAERRKLEELSRQLEELQKQIANLIRRQAGHNFDNLTLQGPERIARLEGAFIDELMTKAERDAEKLGPAPELGQLSTAQEQTERNTRDIAKTAEDLPNGSEPASHLTRAASKMERAIVSLRGKNLPEAYEPPQVEALAALEEAKRLIDEQKRQVDEKLDQQQKEAVRQAYIKIKAAQEKLNVETVRIDKAPRIEDGNLKREDAVRLGQLPGEQGKLSDRTSELEEALSAVGSVVYVWANRDIVDSMNAVKDDLGKPATGVPTQAEQTRIVEQLDAMIRNLAIKPDEKRFAERGGGGGGACCSSGLPSEAELRLLKELQLAINKSTKTIDAQPDKDKPKLLALGNRQGELRNLLDQVLQNASQGQIKLGPEPDVDEQLPEEARKEDVENQELDDDLLNEKASDERVADGTLQVGKRMSRSRQRLAINNDPGQITQVIQDRIIDDLDLLIEEARKQQAQMMAGGQPKPGQKPGAKPGMAQAQNQGAQSVPNRGQNPAQKSTAPGQAQTNTDLSQAIKESAAEWGPISPRARDAVIEGASDQIIEKYRKLVEDYYRGVATEGTERQ